MAVVSSELQERQEMELKAIMAIYDIDVADCRQTDVWKVWRPPEFVIHLRPSSGMSFPCSGSGDSQPDSAGAARVDLHINFSPSYPDEVPKIEIENPKSLELLDVAELEQGLKTVAESRKGEEMILDIAQHVQNFLYALERRKREVTIDASGYPRYSSFYEEMESRRKILLQEEQLKSCEENLQKRNQELVAIEQELIRREEDAKDFENISPERSSSVSKSRGNSAPPDNNAKSVSGVVRKTSGAPAGALTPINKPSPDEEECGVSVTKLVVRGVLQKLFKGAKVDLGHEYGRFGSENIHIRECSAMVEATGQLVTLTEWTLRWLRGRGPGRAAVRETLADREAIEGHGKLLESLEREFQALVKLENPKLIRYLGFDWKQQNDRFLITVIKDSLPGFYVQKYLEMGCALVPEQLRLLALDTLEALEYLHSKSILHRNITPGSVYQSVQCYLLVDYSAGSKIDELCQEFAKAFPPWSGLANGEDDFACSASKFAGLGRISQKSDILMLGHVILSLAQGYATPKDKPPQIPSSLPPDLDQFLQCCVTRQEAEKWTAALLREHPFLVRVRFAPTIANRRPSVGGLRRNVPLVDEEEAALCRENARKQMMEQGEDEEPSPAIPAFSSAYGFSRLASEFDMLLWLGKGGFGDVVKVRNRLDGNIYAIKRIALKPSNKAFNRKITREVKLLSRLNHENVVRYYNSWIETTTEIIREESSETTSPADGDSKHKIISPIVKTEPVATAAADAPAVVLNLKKADPLAEDSFDEIRPSLRSNGVSEQLDSHGDWSGFSPSGLLGQGSTGSDSDSSDTDSESDGLDVFGGGSFYPMASPAAEDDGDVMFEPASNEFEVPESYDDNIATDDENDNAGKVGKNNDCNRRTKSESSTATTASSGPPPLIQILYIQMEFCEKNTLRQLIDSEELIGNDKRCWRLFREILEGLVHIHQQGMIHRDLKPVNIFMDSNDHVKIGDFGLATQGLLKSSSGFAKNPSVLESTSLSNEAADGHLTGRVGTALYVASELMTHGKASYTQKVDMYSLGIILFEIFSPCRTGMERVKTLTELRHPDVKLPKDFEEKPSNHKQVTLLRWLLRHEPEARPSSEELLASPLIPPAEMEDREFHQALVNTLNAPRTRKYHHLMNALFDRQMSYVQDYVYDNEIFKDSFSTRYSLMMENVFRRLTHIFERHGGLLIETPSLVPKSELSDAFDQTPYTLVEPGGTLVYLPYDLRLSFARWVARHDIMQIKRYIISKVFRVQKAVGAHPRELREAAFDIICAPSNAPIAIAELMEAVLAVIREFESLRERKYCIKLNHVSLLKAILLHHGIEAKSLQAQVLATLGDTKREGLSRFAREARLKSLEIPEESVRSLIEMLEKSGSFARINSEMRCITHRKKSLTTELAREGLRELESVKQALESVGFPHPIEISMGLVFNVNEYDGHVMFHVVSEAPPSRKQPKGPAGGAAAKLAMAEILAAGGRYDRLIGNFQYHSLTQSPKPVAGVGVSFAFDRIVSLENHHLGTKRDKGSTRGLRTLPRADSKGSDWERSGNSNLMKSVSAAHNIHSVLTNNSPNCVAKKQSTTVSHDGAVGSGVVYSRIQVLVISTGSKPMLREKLKLTKKCWDLNLSADYLSEPVNELDEVQEAYVQSGLMGLVILKDVDPSQLRVRFFNPTDRDRIVEKKIPMDELTGLLSDKFAHLSASHSPFLYGISGNRGAVTDPSSGPDSLQTAQTGHRVSSASISDSSVVNSAFVSGGGGAATLSNLKIQFVVSEKLAYNTKRRHEQQIQNITCSTVQRFSSRETIELIATELPGTVIKHWTAHFDLRDELGLKNSTFESGLKFNKYKRQLLNVSDILAELRFDKQCAVIIVYSLVDDCFRVVL